MFWDSIAGVYDLFEKIYNKSVYTGTGKKVAEELHRTDTVLECACGTGAISECIAPACKHLTATDFAPKMLAQAEKKLAGHANVTFEQADITALRFEDAAFDAIVAGNVIHLLPEPKKALDELMRVCRPGGKVIIPTYINKAQQSSRLAVRFLELLGANFKRQFDEESYRTFFRDLGYQNVRYTIVPGRMACDIAVIIKPDTPKNA